MAAEKILDAAGELFAEHGIGAVSMGDVARAAGCSRATLYRYFADRHELHVAYVHREARRVGGLVAADASRVRDPEQRLVTAVLSARTPGPREPQPVGLVRRRRRRGHRRARPVVAGDRGAGPQRRATTRWPRAGWSG